MKKIAIVFCIIAALVIGYFASRSGKTPSLTASYSDGVLYYSTANIEGSAPLVLTGYGELGKTVSGTKSGAVYIDLDEGSYILSAENANVSLSAEFHVVDNAQKDAYTFTSAAPVTDGPTAAPQTAQSPSPTPTFSPTPKVTDTPKPTLTPAELVLTADYDGSVLTCTLANVSGSLEIGIDRQSVWQAITSDGTYETEIDLSHGLHTVEALSGGQSANAQIMVHKFETVPAVEAACTQDGLTEGTVCSVCGETQTEQKKIPALGHDVEVKEAIEPTCTEDGNTRGEVCRRCGEVLLKSEVLPALGHDVQKLEAKEPTCTESGCAEGSFCARCGEILTLTSEAVLALLGHDAVVDEGREPTCTEEGISEGKHCARCGEILKEQTVLEALGHLPVTEEIVLPSCTENGLTPGSRCARCGEILKAQLEIPAAGHMWDEWILDGENDCVAEGARHRFCRRCGAEENAVIPALGHNGVWTVVKTGRGGEGLMRQSCTRCGEDMGESALPAIEHSPNTICSVGLKLPEIKARYNPNDDWKMVSPIDLSRDAEYAYPVIGSANYRVGELTVKIENGWLNADITLDEKIRTVYTQGLVFLESVADITGFEETAYSFYTLPARIRLSDLPQERAVMLLIGKVWLNTKANSYPYYRYDSDEYKLLASQMRELLK